MGVMVALMVMTVGVIIMLVAVIVLDMVVMMVLMLMLMLMLMHMLDSCFVAVEPGHIVIMVLEALCKLDVEIAGVDAVLVYARDSDRKAVDRQRGELFAQMLLLAPRSSRAATVISPLMPEVPSMISVC